MTFAKVTPPRSCKHGRGRALKPIPVVVNAVRGSDVPVDARTRARYIGLLGEIPDEGGRGPAMCHVGVYPVTTAFSLVNPGICGIDCARAAAGAVEERPRVDTPSPKLCPNIASMKQRTTRGILTGQVLTEKWFSFRLVCARGEIPDEVGPMLSRNASLKPFSRRDPHPCLPVPVLNGLHPCLEAASDDHTPPCPLNLES